MTTHFDINYVIDNMEYSIYFDCRPAYVMSPKQDLTSARLIGYISIWALTSTSGFFVDGKRKLVSLYHTYTGGDCV